LSKKLLAKVLLFGFIIAVASISFGGPAVAAVKIGTARIAQLAVSTDFESSVLAILGATFLIVASAVRRLQAPAKQPAS
jgi:hypothetical protein